MNNLMDLAEHANAEDLKARFKFLPFSCSTPNRKAEVVSKLQTLLTDSETIKRIWDCLGDTQKLCLQEAVHNHHGHMDAFVFREKYQLPSPSTKGWSKYGRGGDKQDQRLAPFFYPERRYGSAVRIPDDILVCLKPMIPPPPEFIIDIASFDAAETMILESSQHTESELNVLINFIKDRKLKVSAKTGMPSKALLKKLSSQLNEPYSESVGESLETIKAFGWVQVLRASSWIKDSHGQLNVNLKTATLQQKNSDAMKQLFWDWQQNSQFDEFSRIQEVKGQKGKGQRYFTTPESRREACTETLKACPVGEWIAFTDFMRLMAVKGHDYLVTEDTSFLYIGDAHYGRIYEEASLTNAHTRCLMMEYFASLGMIDIAYIDPEEASDEYYNSIGQFDLDYLSMYDGLQYLRLTDLGAYILGLTADHTATPDTKTSVLLLTKLRIQFLSSPTSSERVFLINYADELVNDVWQLSKNRMLAYIENGGDLQELQAFIQARDEQPYLPTEIENLFKTLDENKQAVKAVGPVLLLRCNSETTANNIASAPQLSKWCQRVGKDQLIIPENKESQFRALIHELSYAMPID
ncbi:hypothetical protein [Vibrio metschnikovii]|uniref:hypothetical protein n=1 Tax=Vibrio metschnikovii TaxID=28172 RepID=UPI002FCCA17B